MLNEPRELIKVGKPTVMKARDGRKSCRAWIPSFVKWVIIRVTERCIFPASSVVLVT